jgi:hypothetical protein
MKKIILDNDQFTFTKASDTITFTELYNINHILLITNTTTNDIIYNFGCDGFGGTLTRYTLKLEYDTSSMKDTDDLQIIIYTEEDASDTENHRLLELIRKQTEVQDEMLENLELCAKYLRKLYNPE